MIRAEIILTIAGLLGGAVAFLVGLQQYVKAQRWKRAEWVAQEIRAFFDDPGIAAALKMIDWGGRRVRLFPDRPPGQQEVYVSDDDVAAALQDHTRRGAFNDTEAAIRDAFDRFLDGLERFEHFIEAGLITTDDVRPYLAYWLRNIRRARPDESKAKRFVAVRDFIECYGFAGVEDLFRRFEHDALMPFPPAAPVGTSKRDSRPDPRVA